MDRIPPATTQHLSHDELLWEVLETLIDSHSVYRVLNTLAQIAFQRGSDWREASRLIRTTANALPPTVAQYKKEA